MLVNNFKEHANMNTFDELYSKIMSNYEEPSIVKKPVVDNDKSLDAYELDVEDENNKIVSSDVDCIEDEDSELYDLSVSVDCEDFDSLSDDSDEYDATNELNIDFDSEYADDSYKFDDIEESDLLTEADDDPFATAPAEEAEGDAAVAPDAAATDVGGDQTPEAASEGDTTKKEEGEEAKTDEPVDPAVKDVASYQVKLDLIVSNITAAFKTTINSAGSELYDKIIIYGFEESIKVFIEDYLKKMMDGDIKIDTIEKMDIITFAAPNISQIVKKLIENLAKK